MNSSNPTVVARFMPCAVSLSMAGILFLNALSIHAAQPADISQGALDQIGALLNEKASWTPVQAKMDSQLIHALKNQRGEPFAAGAPHLRLDLETKPDGRVLVDLTANVSSNLLALIKQGGGQVMASVPQFRAVRALVSLDQLDALAASEDVVFIQRAVPAVTSTGSVDSQGDVTHEAGAARTGFGISGAGIKVGVLSDSVDYLTNSQALGDLGPVTVLPGQSGVPGSGEGTAMLEIVHDLAPGAPLYFATAFGSEAGFAQNILNLYSNGCKVIIDDVGYFDESPFQDGIVARAVNTVTAGGALYFSSAANSGNLDAGTSGTWEGDFVDGGAAGAPIAEAGRIHNFGGSNYNTLTASGFTVDLFWADPLGASTNDYDLFLLDSSGSNVVASSMNRQTGTQDPYERAAGSSGERIVIVKYSGDARFLHLDTQRGRLSIPTSGATVGHSAATNAFSVAAVPAAAAFSGGYPSGPFPNPFTPTNQLELFSSDGPRHVFYNANGSPITPGNFLSTGGAIRQKPDITAADGVVTTLPAGSGLNPFFGTSAAAPHAAAIAALIWSYNPALTPSQIRSLLTSTALDIGPPGTDRDSGAGIVMAYQALTNLTGNAPLGINLQPSNQIVLVGGTATFSVTAIGTPPFSYSWQRNGSPIAGATTSTYSTNNVQVADSGSQFSCLVSNVQEAMLSSNGTLTVVVPPANDRCTGALVIATASYTNTESTIYATSTGDPTPTCVGGFGKGVWYQFTAPSDGQFVVDTIGSDFDTGLGVYTGACAALTQVACNDDAGGYLTSRITNDLTSGTSYYILAGGYAAHSGNLVFHLAFTPFTGPPVIVTQPANQTVLVGGAATFSVGATGGRPLYYQWSKASVPIAGATNSAYSIVNAQTNDAASYSVQVTNSFGSITSSNATLTVLTGGGGVVAYFTDNNPAATGLEPPITRAGFFPIHISDIASFSLTNVGMLCINEFNNGAPSSALQGRLADIQSWVSNGGKFIVHDRSAGLLSPNPFLLGTTGAVTVRLTTSDLDVIPPATNLVVEGPFGVINNTTLDGGNSSAHGYVAQTNLPASAYPILSIGGAPSEVASFSYSLGAGTIYYSTIPLDCYLEEGSCTNNVIAPALQNIYTPNVLIYVSNPAPCSNCPPAISSQPVSRNVRPGTNVTFNVTAGGTPPLSYQWRKDGLSLTNSSRIFGATNASLLLSNVVESDSGQYSVSVTNAFGSVLSSNASLLVSSLDHFAWSQIPSPQINNTPFQVVIQAQNASNGTATNFIGAVALSGSTSPSNAVPVTPSLSGNFVQGAWTGAVTVASLATNLVLRADDGAGHNGLSNPFNVIAPNQAPAIVSQPASQSARAGTNVTFTVAAAGATPLSYQWSKNGVNLFDGSKISGSATPSLTISNLANRDGGQYAVLVTNIFGSVLSSNASLTILKGGGHAGVADGGYSNLDHFAWSHIPSPQSAWVPFQVTIQALNESNGIVKDFGGAVGLSGSAGSGDVPVNPPYSGGFVAGVWTGSLVVPQTASNLVLWADDGFGDSGPAEAIDVVSAPRLELGSNPGDSQGRLWIFWPAGSAAVLESLTDLSSGAWAQVPDAPSQIGDQYAVPIETTGVQRFYRLRYSAP